MDDDDGGRNDIPRRRRELKTSEVFGIFQSFWPFNIFRRDEGIACLEAGIECQ